jgi:hypothetical protein
MNMRQVLDEPGLQNRLAGVPESPDWRLFAGRRKTDGAESSVDTSIRRRPFDDAEVTEVQVQV